MEALVVAHETEYVRDGRRASSEVEGRGLVKVAVVSGVRALDTRRLKGRGWRRHGVLYSGKDSNRLTATPSEREVLRATAEIGV
jgi:hypothetical protein